MKILSIFNNKGGVGKTTYMFHIAHILSRRPEEEGRNILIVDLDTQSNLTAYCLEDTEIEKSWKKDGNSIYRVIEPIIRGTGDFCYKKPTKIPAHEGNIYLIPGDLRLSDFEDRLGDTWNSARGGEEASLRAQTAIHRHILEAARDVNADVVLIDLGPNLGALNRAALASSDYFITPVAPDLFSIQGTENLGNKLVQWTNQWQQIHNNKSELDFDIPDGKPKYLGYVMQMHNLRKNSESGMTKGWSIYGERLEDSIKNNIVNKIGDERIEWNNKSLNIGKIPNLHSLVPYSQKARKPIFDCSREDGLQGGHENTAKKSIEHFDEVIDIIERVIS